MDSNLLKVFISVSHTKSFSLAAKELGFTQSNVTLRIKQLEKNMGYPLFHRTNKGVILSFEGEKFYPYAVEIIKKVEEATLKMRNINHQELLKIGSTQSNATVRIIPFINQINKNFEDMKLEFTVDSTLNLIPKLLDYKIDIAFVNGNPNHKDIEVLNIFKDDMFLVEPKNINYEKTIFSFKIGCANCVFLENYVKFNFKESYKVKNLQNYELILGCVKAGYGLTMLPYKIVEKFGYLGEVKLTKIENNLDTHLISRKDYIPMIEHYLRSINL